jgi:hypothetical protein
MGTNHTKQVLDGVADKLRKDIAVVEGEAWAQMDAIRSNRLDPGSTRGAVQEWFDNNGFGGIVQSGLISRYVFDEQGRVYFVVQKNRHLARKAADAGFRLDDPDALRKFEESERRIAALHLKSRK